LKHGAQGVAAVPVIVKPQAIAVLVVLVAAAVHTPIDYLKRQI
jgi:hypothetical protein